MSHLKVNGTHEIILFEFQYMFASNCLSLCLRGTNE